MAIMWNGSLLPNIDPSGAPYSGLKAYFFNAGTTTPRTTYRDGNLGESHDHPVVANASGKFPAVFLPPGDYRLRIETSTGVTLDDVDGITTPVGEPPETPEGETPVELLARTGDLKCRWGVGSHSGWVRLNGRTIGNASSGAAERANDDCEDLFLFLWDADENLAVSGGRGASAAGDWAASKTIALPDGRHRALFGLGDMGNSNAERIGDDRVTGGDNAELGGYGGVDDVTLSIGQLPTITPAGSVTTTGTASVSMSQLQNYQAGNSAIAVAAIGSGAPTSNPLAATSTFSGTPFGSGQAHTNMPPFLLITIYIKL